MQIQISDFEPIKQCKIDLDKALVVIFSENNIGKSYVASAIYLLLRFF